MITFLKCKEWPVLNIKICDGQRKMCYDDDVVKNTRLTLSLKYKGKQTGSFPHLTSGGKEEYTMK